MKLNEVNTVREKAREYSIAQLLQGKKITKYISSNVYDFSHERINSLVGLPESIYSPLDLGHNPIDKLDCKNIIVHGWVNLSSTKLRSLQGVEHAFASIDDYLYISTEQIKSHVLGVFLIKKIQMIVHTEFFVKAGSAPEVPAAEWVQIVNDHLKNGKKGMYDCQDELIENHLDEYAQL